MPAVRRRKARKPVGATKIPLTVLERRLERLSRLVARRRKAK